MYLLIAIVLSFYISGRVKLASISLIVNLYKQ